MNTQAPALVLVAALAVASCAGDDTTATAPPPPARALSAEPAVTPMPASTGLRIGAPLSRFGGTFQVNRITCRQFLAAPERDRDAVAIFVYGYLVARAGNKDIETGQVDADLHRVIDGCSQSPDMTVADVFRRTSSAPARWFWQSP